MSWNIGIPTAEWYEPGDERLDGLIREVADQKVVAIDTETTGLSNWKDLPLFWSIAWGNRKVCMPASTLQYFQKPVFSSHDRTWVLANAKFDMHILANFGITLNGSLMDICVMHALLYDDMEHGLKFVSDHILGWRWRDFEDTFEGNMKKEGSTAVLMRAFEQNKELLIEYASNDAFGTLRSFEELKKQLERERTWSLYPDRYSNLWDVFRKTEAPYTRVLWKCERHGALIDNEFLSTVRDPIKEKLDDIQKAANKWGGRDIKLNSSEQLIEILIKDAGLRPVGWTDGGKRGIRKPKMDEKFFELYRNDHPIAGLAHEYKQLTKLLSTYVDGIPKWQDHGSRIHPRFNQDVARTGRLSASEPNTQNIPNPENDIFQIRRAFVARPGYKIICLDYEALEMRLLAAASMEPAMVDLFKKGWDIHMGNASMVFGMPYEDIKAAKKKDKKQHTDYDKQCLRARADVKAIGFGLNYGMKEKLLAANLGRTVDEAIEIRERYLATYPTVNRFYEEAIETARETSMAYTLMGRRRRLPNIHSDNSYFRFQAERQAVNMEIQGTAADVVRMAMIAIDELNIDNDFGANMFMQVHDELLFECPEETAEEAKAVIQEMMAHPLDSDLAVPLTTSGHICDDWSQAK